MSYSWDRSYRVFILFVLRLQNYPTNILPFSMKLRLGVLIKTWFNVYLTVLQLSSLPVKKKESSPHVPLWPSTELTIYHWSGSWSHVTWQSFSCICFLWRKFIVSGSFIIISVTKQKGPSCISLKSVFESLIPVSLDLIEGYLKKLLGPSMYWFI